MKPVVGNPLTDRAERLIELNSRLTGEQCPVCSEPIEAVDIANSGVEPDPDVDLRMDVDEGDILLAHARTFCVANQFKQS